MKLRSAKAYEGKELKMKLQAPMEIKLSDGDQDGPGTFDAVAYSGGTVPGYAFGLDRPVVIDLGGMELARNVVANLDHKTEKRVGHVTDVNNDGKQLHLSGVLSAATPYRDEVAESARNGFNWEVSIEGGGSGIKKLPAKKTVQVNGQDVTGPAYIVRKAKLSGVAFVSNGADEGNAVQIAASAARENPMSDFEKFALNLGVADLDDVSDEHRTNLENAFKASQSTPVPPAAPAAQKSFDDMAAAARAEHGRQETIGKFALAWIKDNPQLADQIQDSAGAAIADPTVDPEKFELEMRRSARAGSGIFAVSRDDKKRSDPKLMECALAMTAGLNAEKAYGADMCQRVEDAGMRGFGLQQAIVHAAAMNGCRLAPGEGIRQGNLSKIFKAAFRDPDMHGFQMAGEWSTINLPNILGAVANKALLEGYMEEDSTWREIADVRSVSNFHTHSFYRMLDNLEYEELAPGGLIPHGDLSEESYSVKASTFGKMLGLTRVDIINDDLSAFDRIRTRLGMGAAQKFNNVVWAKFMDNAAHYTSGNGNFIDGATSNLGLDGVGLEQGILAYRTQKSPVADGEKRVGASLSRPTKLLVPPELEFIAQRLHQSTNLVSGADATPGNPDANIHLNQYRPVVQPRLSDAAFTGNSATGWYLLGDQLKPVVVVFLNGQQTPIVESADADFNTLGVLFRGYFDAGVDFAEYLGSIKSKGAA